MTAPVDMNGRTFGLLRVIERSGESTDGKPTFLCSCACGGSATVRGNYLRSGHTTSCGCQRGKHSKTPEATKRTRKTYQKMIERCSNPKHDKFGYYGGRGISVCERWRSGFQFFFEDMGNRPEAKTLDRIDVNGDYEPGNCRWATWPEQCANKRKRAA